MSATATPGDRPDGARVRDRREVWARGLLLGFGVAALADLGSLVAGADAGHLIAKPLLMPLLAAYAMLRGAPRLLVAALLFGWGGDVFLLSDAEPAFMAGMGSFAAGHVCYLVLFGRSRQRSNGVSRTYPLLGAGYAVALVATVALLWPDLPVELRIPVAGYSLLLTAMAWRASGLGLYAGLGGALFLLSDTLIATGVAEWPQLPAPDFWIMLTYVAAQCLLAMGVLARRASPAPGDGAQDPVAYREGRTAA
ncbi:lysoplasmalogenase [Streptomyces sp. ISL-98]|uniref:lysoplasmalogenase n=1 Tax=Streptomyces sp. ISL-98 TaxID=2819192 RepID=UPI001BE7079D|nr:lysoplasmalogenase [Streptomyces sp. ISL-98]MBT2504329.1 lysoplasmalogenase [Streptomyces sp. ISL-98]